MDTPLVVAALRFTDPHATVDPLTGAVHPRVRGAGLSAADECALEHALRVSGALGGRCLAITAGPSPAEDILREALAAGATGALRILDGGDGGEEHTARVLAETIVQRHGTPAVVLCGDRSPDRGTGATPALLAARLGARQALGLVGLEVRDRRLHAERRLDGGRRELLAMDTPAVCSVEPTLRLRRAPLPGVLAARQARIDVAEPPASTVDDRVRHVARRPYRPRTRVIPAPDAAAPHERMLALTGALDEHEPPRLVHPADAREAADELIGYLRQHGYLT